MLIDSTCEACFYVACAKDGGYEVLTETVKFCCFAFVFVLVFPEGRKK